MQRQLNEAHSPDAPFWNCLACRVSTCSLLLQMGCKGPAGSDDAMHMLKLWVAVSNMRRGKMVLRQHGCASIQTAVDVLLGWSRSFGGRGSMATQHTDKELAPHKAAGKVLVPLGRECHWETSRPGFRSLQRSFLQRCGS